MSASHSLKALLLAAALATGIAAPLAHAEDHAADRDGHHQFSPEQRTQWAKQRLDHLANRLQITASQQPAWETFSAALLSLSQHEGKRPAADADAATLARFHADRAAAFASKLATVADATAKLQDVLDDNQRKILTQVAHLAEHRFHHGDHEGRGFHGGHDQHHDDE